MKTYASNSRVVGALERLMGTAIVVAIALAAALRIGLSAVLFGCGHYYKGPAGILDSGVAGLILGGAYLVSGRVLWTCILAHGFIDTFGVAALYFGWES